MLTEGSRVTYTGAIQGRLATGAGGRLLSISGDGGHVLFSTGAVAGAVEFLPLTVLAEYQAPEPSLIADALDAPEALSSLSVRETVASTGEQGLVAALGEAGVLDELASICEEAAEFVASRVRADQAMESVMAALDTEERDQVVALTSAMLLRSAANYESESDA